MDKVAFYLHDDMEMLAGLYPFALLEMSNMYVMQEDRVVFVGTRDGYKNWAVYNYDKILPNIIKNKGDKDEEHF